MRVLLIAFACEPGRGSEQEVGWRWALELSKHIDITVLTQTRNRNGIENGLAKLDAYQHNLKFEYLELPRILYKLKSRFNFLTLPYYAVWLWFAAMKVRTLHSLHPFQILHHLTFATFRVPIWLKRVGPPVVIGPVGGAERAPWPLLAYRCRPSTWIPEAIRNVMTSIGIALLRFLPPIYADRGICLAATPAMLHIFEKQGLPTRLFPTIGAEGNEINVPRIYEQKCNFLYVGRLHVLKGVQFLLSALADARLNDAKLTVVGSGPDEKRLKKQAYEIGIGSRVTWIGQCRREELPSFYASHDVVVAPSMYESGGLVAIEAMEQGIPCIVIDVGGHAVSVSADCGIKIAPENSASKVIKDLANAMLKYKTNIELRKIHGNNARTRVRNNYGWQAKTTKILSLYNYLIDQSEKQLRR